MRKRAKEYVSQVGKADLLVGIPSYYNEKTISHVIEMVGKGLKEYFPTLKGLIVISDGGSTDDTREVAEKVPLPQSVEKVVTIYRGLPGKGTSLRAVFEVSEIVEPQAVVLIDSDLRSITPQWLKLLAEPIIEKEYHFVSPCYLRQRCDGTITKLIAAPLTRAIFGMRIQQPIGGEFGISGDLAQFYARQRVWETDIARYGIDIWLTVMAIEHGVKMCQSCLGSKVHKGKDPSTLGPMFRQVVGTLFSLMAQYEACWYQMEKSQEIEIYETQRGLEPEPVEVSTKDLIENFRLGFNHFRSLWQEVLSPQSYVGVEEIFLSRRKFSFSSSLWAKVVYDFAVNFKKWRRDRQKLVSIMTPLYYGRTASYILETEGMSLKDADKVVERQGEIFEELKPYLAKRASKAFEQA